jgi:hypothetical protein
LAVRHAFVELRGRIQMVGGGITVPGGRVLEKGLLQVLAKSRFARG